jgi:hypothetical protein
MTQIGPLCQNLKLGQNLNYFIQHFTKLCNVYIHTEVSTRIDLQVPLVNNDFLMKLFLKSNVLLYLEFGLKIVTQMLMVVPFLLRNELIFS